MTSSKMFVLFFALIIRLSTCDDVVDDVEYSFKYSYEGQSDHKGDGFGYSLATFNHKLVVGAPGYNNTGGSITVMPDGVQVRGPADGIIFEFEYSIQNNLDHLQCTETFLLLVFFKILRFKCLEWEFKDKQLNKIVGCSVGQSPYMDNTWL